MRVSKFLGVDVNNAHPYTVSHVNFAKLVQVRMPMAVLRQVLCHPLGDKDVSRVAQSHHPLCNINSNSSHVPLIVNVPNLIDGPTVDTHPQTKVGMVL